jgi:hypothetical protein
MGVFRLVHNEKRFLAAITCPGFFANGLQPAAPATRYNTILF